VSETVKTITPRTLLREPLKLKRLMRTGKSARITGGKARERRRGIDRVFSEVLCERPSKISAARLLEESRR
jgi:hypothetical protein